MKADLFLHKNLPITPVSLVQIRLKKVSSMLNLRIFSFLIWLWYGGHKKCNRVKINIFCIMHASRTYLCKKFVQHILSCCHCPLAYWCCGSTSLRIKRRSDEFLGCSWMHHKSSGWRALSSAHRQVDQILNWGKHICLKGYGFVGTNWLIWVFRVANNSIRQYNCGQRLHQNDQWFG